MNLFLLHFAYLGRIIVVVSEFQNQTYRFFSPNNLEEERNGIAHSLQGIQKKCESVLEYMRESLSSIRNIPKYFENRFLFKNQIYDNLVNSAKYAN
jgi:hypothetical protein